MTVFNVTGPDSTTEGQNITLTVTRQGDLSQAAYIKASQVQWGNFSPSMQMTFSGDQEAVNERLLQFAPGIAQQTLSYQTYADGENENWEYSFVSFTPIDYFGEGRTIYRPQDHVATNMGSAIWGTKVYDQGQTPTPTPTPTPTQPTVTQTTPFATQTVSSSPLPAAPSLPSVVNNVDNSTNYTDNSTSTVYNNSFNQDNSTNTTIIGSYNTDNSYNSVVSGSYNTDNSVNSYNLSYVLNSNDYSISNTVEGNGKLRGTEENDLITGGKKNDKIYGDSGNDELIGGNGRDRLFGGHGSNVFDAGSSKSKKDADRLYLLREENAASADIIESLGKSDRVYIQGATGDLSVRGIEGGLGIFDDDILQAIYTGNNFNASTLNNQLVAA